MTKLYDLIRPLLMRLDAERAHTLVARALRMSMQLPGSSMATRPLRYQDTLLRSTVAGITFENPLGLAAGFDKDGRYVQGMARLGFGLVEVGTVTPRPQAGNPLPRIFRLREDRALINRMGFNNDGMQALAQRVGAMRRPVPLGINIGKNRDTAVESAAEDYLACFRTLAPLADYVAVNVSSPNTPGLRALQRAEPLAEILGALTRERERMAAGQRPPIFVKLSPDETPAGLDTALEVVLRSGLDGIIATNTTVERPATLRGALRDEAGGLSGQPLQARSTAVIRYLYRALEGRLPLIGVGGIDGPDTAYEKIVAGASLVQLYTALIYEGPTLPRTILRGLAVRLKAEGFKSLQQAIGSNASQGVEV